MKTNQIRFLLAVIVLFSFTATKAQWKDSASYKQAVIQFYKQQTTGNKLYKFVPNGYTQIEQDTMFANALAWKKETLDRPMILNYYGLKKGTPEADAKLKYLEDSVSRQEYNEVMTKAAQLYAKQRAPKAAPKHVAPGLSTSPNTSGKIESKDKEITEKILKTWKF